MDKYEYKVRSEEIKELISQREYVRAAEIADTIDWRRVKSVMMLCTISDLYKINRRYEDSRDLLLLAYDRHPGGRTIVYALCELSIKMGELPQAVEYCKEFVQIAPKDPGRFILQYKIYEAQGVSLEERIEVLEELKKYDYREKWAYELAYLYHRIGLASKCVDECDEMIVWFGDGKFVVKAMELKMLHQPLTPEQQWKYDNRFTPVAEEVPVEKASVEETVVEEIPAELVGATEAVQEPQGTTAIWSGEEVTEAVGEDLAATKQFSPEEIDIQVKTMDPNSQYNTINLQAEVAAGLRELLENTSKDDEITRAILEPMMETDSIDVEATRVFENQNTEESEVFFGDTVEIPLEQGEATTVWTREEVEDQEQATIIWNKEEVQDQEQATTIWTKEEVISQEQVTTTDTSKNEEDQEQATIIWNKEDVEKSVEEDATAIQVMEQLRKENAEPPKEMAKVLSMEADGQISFIMPEKEKVEQQITGQLSIEDIMAEWERMKKELEEKGKEKVRLHVKENTGQMFTEFEASVRDGLLEQLENGKDIDAVIAEAEGHVQEEEEIPVPLSLMEDVEDEEEPAEIIEEPIPVVLTSEDEVEELEEIADITEEAEEVEEASEEVLVEIEEVPEEVFEETEETSEEVLEEVEEAEEVFEEAPDEMDGLGADAEETLEEIEEAEELYEEEIEEAVEVMEEIEEADEEQDEEEPEEYQKKTRNLTKEERELFSPYIQGRSSKEQLIQAIDNISMAAYTGNVIITGAEGLDTMGLARDIIRDMQMTDSNFSGKSAKISGEALNKRNVAKVLNGLENGALIIQRAGSMNAQTAEDLYRALQQENTGIVVILEGTKKTVEALVGQTPKLLECFTSRVDMEALSDAALVAFCKKYAYEKEFALDELAVLALHGIITNRQTNDHAVTILEVKEIMDEAMNSASRKSIGHFFDIISSKRYDEEDMIIIREKDFIDLEG